VSKEKKSGLENVEDLFHCPVEFFVGGNHGCKQVPARDAVKKEEEGGKGRMRGRGGGEGGEGEVILDSQCLWKGAGKSFVKRPTIVPVEYFSAASLPLVVVAVAIIMNHDDRNA
jgi:hypothetical protein